MSFVNLKLSHLIGDDINSTRSKNLIEDFNKTAKIIKYNTSVAKELSKANREVITEASERNWCHNHKKILKMQFREANALGLKSQNLQQALSHA